ncbi:MAG: hypothetical protein ACTHOB_08645 [Ginsengibacter sp.]
MRWIKFITTYWSQIAILIASIGYILKIILDYKFKQKEIWYTLYAQKKMDYTLKYLEFSYKIESKTLGIISVLKMGKINDLSQHKELDTLDLAGIYIEAGHSLNCLEFFINKREYETLKNGHIKIGGIMQTLNILLQKLSQENLLVTEFENLYQETLASIQANSKEFIVLRK